MSAAEEMPLVVVRSLVYNHEPYLRNCLDGFVMQQTTFPFVAVVHDDCSTDGSAAILREYAEKYPHIIKPVYETENQYSKHDGSLRRAMDEACGKYGAKYYALCEGDDCWTDPHKLQKQVDFLEAHPGYTMVCCNCVMEMADKRLTTHEDFVYEVWPHIDESRDIAAEELIECMGRMGHTAGLVYRSEVRQLIPEAAMKCRNGDYKLQITAALAGRVYHMRDSMFVYRYKTPGSWNARSEIFRGEKELYDYMSSFIHMLDIFNEASGRKYEPSFHKAQETLVVRKLRQFPNAAEFILKHFGHILEFRRVSSYRPLNCGVLVNLLLRACYHPYYPLPASRSLVNKAIRPFYTMDDNKGTFHIGPLNICSIVESYSLVHVYILGKMIHYALASSLRR